ncbi:MAG: hypothetical protein Q7T93_04375 [Methylobacterium sp.]|uniref:hypothetical protein n=1 Tax=Methylobacterium sp. TaxID=409 RepID=UPI00272645D8|nr:hypothetical protein [Methylobacterium sp.]MDO9426046.1 hypothetical protein [Methylobacterium sp.]
MRLILVYFALAQARLAMLDVERSRLLGRRSDEALARGEERMRAAFALAGRAGLSRR